MNISKCLSDWETFACLDAKWAILTRSSKKFGRWSKEEFFATGKKEIGDFIDRVKELGIEITFGAALDFGCGIGRLSRALAGHFAEVCGVDISKDMISTAREMHKGNGRIKLLNNPQADLACLQNNQFDLVYSFITLQHVPQSEVIRNYLREFIRVLKPGGLLYFQLPTIPDYSWLRSGLLRARGRVFNLMVQIGVSPQYCFSRLKLAPYMHMSFMPSCEIKGVFSQIATVLCIDNDNCTNTTFFVRK